MGLTLFVILRISHLAWWKFINQVSSHSWSLLVSSCRRMFCHFQGWLVYGFGGIMLSSLGCFHRPRNILMCVVVLCGVLYHKVYWSRGGYSPFGLPPRVSVRGHELFLLLITSCVSVDLCFSETMMSETCHTHRWHNKINSLYTHIKSMSMWFNVQTILQFGRSRMRMRMAYITSTLDLVLD